MSLIPFEGQTPQVADDVWLAPSSTLIGRVSLGAFSSVFFGTLLRGDSSDIVLGERSNLQDNVVVHADAGYPARVGDGVSVGHGAVLHGCTIGDDSLIGMNATVLNGAVIGANCLIAAGAVVLEGAVVPDGSLVAGVPGRVRRELTEDEREGIRTNASHYVELSRAYGAS
ncbi:gamma carbonic anhydrase family protein [Agreia sp.]|uniref:gamma carbonic anhydrase family protein n=1 Tax=Agreia sp. TaxID=1872416 RepID=UPI0035BBE62D